MLQLKKETLRVDNIWANRIETEENGKRSETQVLGINWSCNMGFGEYRLYFCENGTKIIADSEYMDSNTDKEFLHALLEKVAEMADVQH